ncbi:hypothetical protein ENSA7_42300 [Enhygromyxa salina]|uniref:Uncharacterized protein n=1 Tax=Enhygromyxa salina TaxID=215803 RepID=A0A2S9YLX7_9BACT|nr:hypothetical protein ENSA7_42300 [Enhygromyxa salina]
MLAEPTEGGGLASLKAGVRPRQVLEGVLAILGGQFAGLEPLGEIDVHDQDLAPEAGGLALVELDLAVAAVELVTADEARARQRVEQRRALEFASVPREHQLRRRTGRCQRGVVAGDPQLTLEPASDLGLALGDRDHVEIGHLQLGRAGDLAHRGQLGLPDAVEAGGVGVGADAVGLILVHEQDHAHVNFFGWRRWPQLDEQAERALARGLDQLSEAVAVAPQTREPGDLAGRRERLLAHLSAILVGLAVQVGDDLRPRGALKRRRVPVPGGAQLEHEGRDIATELPEQLAVALAGQLGLAGFVERQRVVDHDRVDRQREVGAVIVELVDEVAAHAQAQVQAAEHAGPRDAHLAVAAVALDVADHQHGGRVELGVVHPWAALELPGQLSVAEPVAAVEHLQADRGQQPAQILALVGLELDDLRVSHGRRAGLALDDLDRAVLGLDALDHDQADGAARHGVEHVERAD